MAVQLWDPYPLSYPNLENQPPPMQVPRVCTCCLKPTTSQVEIGWHTSSKNTVGASRIQRTEWARATFFVCEECQMHEKDYLHRRGQFIRWVVFLASLLANAILFFFADPLKPIDQPLGFLFGVSVWILLPTGLALICIVLLSLIIRLPELPPRHASRTKGVAMTWRRSFTFDNVQYGLVFALANKATEDKARGRSLLEGKPLLTILSVSIPLSIVITFVLGFLFAMPAMGLNPWCSRVGIPLLFLFLLFVGSREEGGYIG